ncbi:hypothetical protein AAHN97_15430 [Chitinophaga niabensis]|uniref:hypothetical protein n=1 Tax=Chitinophaga niabensis TaxID=536979 RepID=UPI0031BB991B
MKKKKYIAVTVQPKARPASKPKPKVTPSTPTDIEYQQLFDTCVITKEKVAEVDKVIDEKVLINRPRYEQIATQVQGAGTNFGLPMPSVLGGTNFFQPRNFYQTPVPQQALPSQPGPLQFPGLLQRSMSTWGRSNPFNLGFTALQPDFLFSASGRIPWFFIACVHYLECSFNFSKHLHNGDPLTGYTVQVPAGRPKVGHPPPFTFEESAVDALKFMKFDKVRQWTLPFILRKLEAYNGFGYFKYKKINSPYLWSFSGHYTKGKYVKDGKFDKDAVSQQMGSAVILKRMEERGLIYIPRF